MMAERFRSALTQADMISSSTVTTVAGQFVKLGERKIEAGELLALGFGAQSGQESAQGRIYVDMQNATVAVEGTVRLQVYSPQNRPMVILGEWRTETLRTGDGDRTKQVPLPEDIYFLSEDKKLVLEFQADASGIVDKSKTKIIFDTTTETV